MNDRNPYLACKQPLARYRLPVLNFKLFNIPVRIQPLFWLGAFVIGGGLSIEISSQGRDGLIATIFSMIAILISILVHELGHAFTSRKLTQVNPAIELVAFGGFASPNTHLSRRETFLVTWAGPLAGFALFFAVVLLFIGLYGPSDGFHFASLVTFPWTTPRASDLEVLTTLNPFALSFLMTMLWANFWWNAINLLPVFPLDGGRIYASIEDSALKIHRVGMITAGLAVCGALYFRFLIGAILFGFLAYQNFQQIQAINGRQDFR